ncbi:hypothetical protein HRI_001349000 [Hibiscus trionum]|uniref:Reverse transcriptase zinc-binding domain-containing protein n=1 Tax=Hibiscus trionum TaxID=183268 RepID=A0A9W7HH35_HIBTR|nr:hypothetical protein HRI_001349000 [Hibiscus trionum]
MWLGNLSLMEEFPRIYALATNKVGRIAEFRINTNNNWKWCIHLRRNLFGWEEQQWSEFMTKLSHFTACASGKDWVRWLGASDGIFSIKSLRSLSRNTTDDNSFWKRCVWLGLAPPKIEIFVWQAVWGRLPVKSELRKRGSTNLTNACCPLCNGAPETIRHLFIECTQVWKLWGIFCAMAGIAMVLPGDIKSLMESWVDLKETLRMEWLLMVPFAVLWSIWLMRNEIIFSKKSFDGVQLSSIIKLRLTFWYKAKFPDYPIPFEALVADFSLVSSWAMKKVVANPTMTWLPPPPGFLKLNTDGAMSTDLRCDIGCILRNDKGLILWQLSSSSESSPPACVELEAMCVGLSYFYNSGWEKRFRLILESDCKEAVDWCKNFSSPPAQVRQKIQVISEFVLKFGLCIRWIPRRCNIEADSLAKKEIG